MKKSLILFNYVCLQDILIKYLWTVRKEVQHFCCSNETQVTMETHCVISLILDLDNSFISGYFAEPFEVGSLSNAEVRNKSQKKKKPGGIKLRKITCYNNL